MARSSEKKLNSSLFLTTNKKESLSLSRQSLSLYQTPQTPPIVLQLQTTIIYSNLVCQNYQNYPKNWEISSRILRLSLWTFSLAHFLSRGKLERMCENTGRSESRARWDKNWRRRKLKSFTFCPTVRSYFHFSTTFQFKNLYNHK